jgi:hypothetical protein
MDFMVDAGRVIVLPITVLCEEFQAGTKTK